MSARFVEALRAGENELLGRVLAYAAEGDFTRYATTKEEEWRTAVGIPTRGLASWLESHPQAEGIHVAEHPSESEAARFGVIEARQHRARGVTLEMFLGLVKLLRLAVIDLAWDVEKDPLEARCTIAKVLRFFDKFELGVCAEWVTLSEPERLAELKAANRRMTNERTRYLTVFQSMAEPAYVVDRDMTIIAVNAALAHFYGVPAEALLGRSCSEVLVHSHCSDCPLRAAMRDRTSFSGVEQQVPVAGVKRTVLMSGSFLDDISGKHTGGVVLLQDITERKAAETALRASEEKYRTIFETAAMLIVTVDENAVVLDCNPRIETTLGYTRAEVVGNSIGMLLPRNSLARAKGHLRDLVAGGVLRDEVYRMVKKDGAAIDVRIDSSSVRDQDGRFERAIILIDDITAQKGLEAQFLQSQKMEAVGRLAGGVAHDFNNLLTVMIGSCAFLNRKMPANDPMHSDLDQITRAADRAAALTRQLLAFSRRQVLRSEVVNLNTIIGDLDGMIRRLIGEDVELVTETALDLGCVRADSSQIEQVIMNLVVNARDAMVRGGRLRLRTANVEVSETEVRARPGLKPGPHVLLEVSDTGEGMDEETRSRMFEPFFTTKARGTGLGLSTAYGIIRQSGGHIVCDSSPGKGAVFSIWLPVAESPTPAKETKADQASAPTGTGVVMVVEDEQSVRELACEALRASGYSVLEARSGEEALAQVTDLKDSIDLLVTDVVMPHMSGRELAEELGQRLPTIKVLFMSGYSADAFAPAGLPRGAHLLLKPFTPEQLASKAREVLDGS